MKIGILMYLASLLLACGPSAAEVTKNSEAANEARMTQLNKRASFDLNCEQIKIDCLGTEESNLYQQGDTVCKTAGVTGCGNRSTYIWTQTSQASWQWIMNTDSKNEEPHRNRAPKSPGEAAK